MAAPTYCLVVITAKGCGHCDTYRERDEEPLKAYVKARGDITYRNLNCDQGGKGVSTIITEEDDRGRTISTRNMEHVLGIPFDRTEPNSKKYKMYSYATAVVYMDDPMKCQETVPSFYNTKGWVVQGKYSSIVALVESCLGRASSAQEEIKPDLETQGEITKKIFVVNGKATKVMENKKGVQRHQPVPEDMMYTTETGEFIPVGYKIEKDLSGKKALRRAKK